MAKSSRSKSVKVNNRRLKAKVFGPVEAARIERLSSKLLELAAQPKPAKPEADSEMKIEDETEGVEANVVEDVPAESHDAAAMDVDSAKPTSSKSNTKNRISKRRKPSKIVFQTYKDRNSKKRKH